jgi:hypothetical protein
LVAAQYVAVPILSRDHRERFSASGRATFEHLVTWWVPPDSNRDAPREHSALQAGAANRIRLTPKTCGGESGNRTQSRASAWHVSSVLACHLPHSPLAPGHGFEPRVTALETVSLTIGNPGVRQSCRKTWRKVEESNPADSSPARAFRERLATVHRHFPWSTRRPSKPLIRGLQSRRSSTLRSGAQLGTQPEIRTRNVLILSQADLPIFLAGQNQKLGRGGKI